MEKKIGTIEMKEFFKAVLKTIKIMSFTYLPVYIITYIIMDISSWPLNSWWAISIRVFMSFAFYTTIVVILEKRKRLKRKIEGRVISTLDPYGEENWNN